MVSKTRKVHEVVAAVQHYEWGLVGSNSLVARLCAANSDVAIDECKPYAELWMGTHPNAPSRMKTSEGLVPLKDRLLQDLPFLFKVLSVGKALSIQAHPDPELAVKLHAKDPKNYRDPNHKPEMTIALTPFEALCGFRLLNDIVRDLDEVPELRHLVDPEKVEELRKAVGMSDETAQRAALKSFFAQFIAADKKTVIEAINSFISRITSINRPTSALEELCLRLNSQFPEEVGCFCVFLFNYVILSPGEAMFLAANEPHAYLSGDCVECMALSDNVVRAGLTPKFRDVETLVEMLTYKMYAPEELAMQPAEMPDRRHSLLYQAPVREFSVIRTLLGLGERELVRSDQSDSILLCVKGELRASLEDEEEITLKPGTILLMECNAEMTLTSQASEALLFQAFSQ